MKRVSAMAIQDGNANDATLNAVIIYDTLDLAVKAKVMLERGRTDEPTHWNVKPWRVDMLKLPLAADVALTEAAKAHLMLLAVRQVQSFLPWLLDWLERWAICRQVKETGLAVWDGGTLAHARSERHPELSHFAGHHGLSWIFDDHALVEDKSRMDASDLHQREVSLTPTLQHILEQPVRCYYPHWGINN
jgi:hypothetical protein